MSKDPNMSPIENLYYALGELAYSVARADGRIQTAEKNRFSEIVIEELKNNEYNIDVADIIFKLMEREKQDSQTTYDWAMNQIRTNSHYLSPKLKESFVRVMEKIASAYPPVTAEERNIINRFKNDIAPLHGDPVYYGKL